MKDICSPIVISWVSECRTFFVVLQQAESPVLPKPHTDTLTNARHRLQEAELATYTFIAHESCNFEAHNYCEYTLHSAYSFDGNIWAG